MDPNKVCHPIALITDGGIRLCSEYQPKIEGSRIFPPDHQTIVGVGTKRPVRAVNEARIQLPVCAWAPARLEWRQFASICQDPLLSGHVFCSNDPIFAW